MPPQGSYLSQDHLQACFSVRSLWNQSHSVRRSRIKDLLNSSVWSLQRVDTGSNHLTALIKARPQLIRYKMCKGMLVNEYCSRTDMIAWSIILMWGTLQHIPLAFHFPEKELFVYSTNWNGCLNCIHAWVCVLLTCKHIKIRFDYCLNNNFSFFKTTINYYYYKYYYSFYTIIIMSIISPFFPFLLFNLMKSKKVWLWKVVLPK